MKRSTVQQNSNDNYQINDNKQQQQQRKRLLDDENISMKSKKRRHISPNSSKNKKKSKTRTSTTTHTPTSRKSSSRRQSFSVEYLNEISLPNWERLSPNIDQILSINHTQSGVYAHEIHLVQQELEALLSMSIVRENILQEVLHSKTPESIRLKINQHQQAENIYTIKKNYRKSLPPLVSTNQQRHNGPHLLLDRQVTVTPIIGARIDKIWTDVNTYYHKVSSNDILNIENLFGFNQELEQKIQQYKNEYKNNVLTQENVIEQLNEENFQDLINISQTNPLINHYVDRTAIGRFQTKLYEHMPHTSPVYKTPISSPFYRKSLGNYTDNASRLRISPRLHSNHRIGHFSFPNLKPDDDIEQSSSSKSKKKTRFTSIDPSSSIQLQERIQLVRDYLTDQHPILNEKPTRHSSNDIKSTKRRKNSLTLSNDHCTDIFESKLSTLISLLHECSLINLSALNRARSQSTNEQLWQKLTTLEHDFELLIQKLDITGGDNNNSTNIEKTFQTLENLLKDWNKYEDDFNHQFEQLE